MWANHGAPSAFSQDAKNYTASEVAKTLHGPASLIQRRITPSRNALVYLHFEGTPLLRTLLEPQALMNTTLSS